MTVLCVFGEAMSVMPMPMTATRTPIRVTIASLDQPEAGAEV